MNILLLVKWISIWLIRYIISFANTTQLYDVWASYRVPEFRGKGPPCEYGRGVPNKQASSTVYIHQVRLYSKADNVISATMWWTGQIEILTWWQRLVKGQGVTKVIKPVEKKNNVGIKLHGNLLNKSWGTPNHKCQPAGGTRKRKKNRIHSEGIIDRTTFHCYPLLLGYVSLDHRQTDIAMHSATCR